MTADREELRARDLADRFANLQVFEGEDIDDTDPFVATDMSPAERDLIVTALRALALNEGERAQSSDGDTLTSSIREDEGVSGETIPGSRRHRSGGCSGLPGDEVAAGVAPGPSDVIAWISFAGNGNVRFWTSDPAHAEAEKRRGLDLRGFTLAELVTFATLHSPPVCAAWQPIETAPKDGTKIWGWLYDTGIVLMHWMSAEENARADGSDNPDDYIACWVKSGEPEDDWHPEFWKPYDEVGVPPGVEWTGRRWRKRPAAPDTEGRS